MSGVTPRTRQIVLERDQHRCVRCGEYVGPWGDYSIHHRRARGMGGTKRPETNAPANLLTLCGSGTTGCTCTCNSEGIRLWTRGGCPRHAAQPSVPAPAPEDEQREGLAREIYRHFYPGPVNTPDSERTRESDAAEHDRAYEKWDRGREGWAPGQICREAADRLIEAGWRRG